MLGFIFTLVKPGKEVADHYAKTGMYPVEYLNTQLISSNQEQFVHTLLG